MACGLVDSVGTSRSYVMLLAGSGRGFGGQISTTGTSGNGDSDVMLLLGRGHGFCGQISSTGTSGSDVMSFEVKFTPQALGIVT